MPNPPVSGPWPLDEAILRTLLYADIFDFPLTAAEIHRFLVGCTADAAAVRSALERDGLPNAIEAEPPYFFLAGKAYCAHVRRHYLPELQRKWARAASYARLLQSVPFLRGAFITGSLAAGNVDGHSDVDFLLIARPGRLLLCHAWLKVLFRRGLGGAARLVAGDYFDWMCPNFIVSEDDLALPRRDLYTAWEAAQAVPVFGDAACRRFLVANAWIGEFLPNSIHEPRRPPAAAWPDEGRGRDTARGSRRLARVTEALLPGPVAGGMERCLQSWLSRRHMARHRAQCKSWEGVSATADEELERSPSRWQLFPVTTRFRILEAYHYRLRCFGLEPDQDVGGGLAVAGRGPQLNVFAHTDQRLRVDG